MEILILYDEEKVTVNHVLEIWSLFEEIENLLVLEMEILIHYVEEKVILNLLVLGIENFFLGI